MTNSTWFLFGVATGVWCSGILLWFTMGRHNWKRVSAARQSDRALRMSPLNDSAVDDD